MSTTPESGSGAEHTPVLSRWPRPVTPLEQERAIDVLRQAVGMGLLSLDDFTARTDQVMSAADRDTLSGALDGLPEVLTRGVRGDDVLRLRTRHTKLDRTGRWRVPAELVVDAAHTTVSLDFRDAVVTEPVIALQVELAHGTLKLMLPPHMGVDLDGVTQLHSSLPGDEHGARDGPLIVVTGQLRHAKIKVRRKDSR